MIDGDIHQEPEDLRRMMLDSNISAALLARLGDGDSYVRRLTINVITDFAKYGKFADW